MDCKKEPWSLHTAVLCCMSAYDIHGSRVAMLRTLRACKKKISPDAVAVLSLIEKSSKPEIALIRASINICKQVEAELAEGGMFPDGSMASFPVKGVE